MNKKITKTLITILLAVALLFLISTYVDAASLSISTSKSTVSPGETFTVTVSLNGGAGPINASASNGSGSGGGFLDNGSTSFACTAGSSGTVSISASGTVGDYATENDVYVSASKSVSISTSTSSSGGTTTKKPTTTTPKVEVKKSDDSTLKALIVAEGAITPEFSSATREYTLSVPNEITTVNVTATVNNSKAVATVTGNENLQVGENTVSISVKAENGSTSNYVIKVTRAREMLSLKSIIAKTTDKEGNIKELPLTPIFSFDVYDYTLQDIEFNVDKIDIESLANLEGATIEVIGNENLQVGENTIIITVKIPVEGQAEGEEIQEEIKTYTIKINKLPEPTVMQKIKDWFKGIFGTIGTWYGNNQYKIVVVSLIVCVTALFGLTIYMVIDFKNYKKLLDKIKILNETGKTEISSVIENNEINIETDNNEEIVEEEKGKKDKAGRHF